MPLAEQIRFLLHTHPLLFGVIGAVYLFWGWQLYRFTLVMTSVIVGGLFGAALARGWGYFGLVPAVGGAMLFGLLAVPLEKAAVFLLGGLCGAGFGMMVAGYSPESVVNTFWALLGFIVFGGLAVRFFKPIIVIATSLLGSYCITHALAVILGRVPPGKFAYPAPFKWLFVCLFVLGVILQCCRPGLGEEARGTQAAAIAPGGPEAEAGHDETGEKF